MTFFEAFQLIEERLDELPMRDHVGGTYGWTEHSYPRIFELLGNEWAETISIGLTENGTPEDFLKKMTALIDRYDFERYYDGQLERTLVEIYRRQTTKEAI